MTHNQIDYAKHLEDIRHNQIVEKETNRQNVASLNETIRNNTVMSAENVRHNQQYELETNRHNVASEQIERDKNIINRDHYVRQDAVAKQNANETQRNNKFNNEVDVGKLNIDSRYKSALIETAYSNAAANTRNASTNALNSINSAQNNAWNYAINQEKMKQGSTVVNSQVNLNRAKTIKTYVDTAGSTLDLANNIVESASKWIAGAKAKNYQYSFK